MSAFDPFGTNDCTVLDEPHVRVDRVVLADKDGRSVRYSKTYRSTPALDYSWFSTHEGDLLHRLKAKRVSRVVQMAEAAWSNHGSVSKIVTFDAGPSLLHWMDAASGSRHHGSIGGVFSDPRALLLLARSILLALHEVHSKGVVHADIDARNICLPFKPHAQAAGHWTPDWPQLKLIDFAFSFGPEDPLLVPLPVQPDPSLHSPAFMKALEADHQARTSRHVHRLDGRIDLHALGLLLDRMLASFAPRWSTEGDAPAQAAALKDLAVALRALDSSPPTRLDLQTHHQLLRPIDRLLAQQATHEWAPHFQLPGHSSGRPSSPRGLLREGASPLRSPLGSSPSPAATPLAATPAAATPLHTSTSTTMSPPSRTPVAAPLGQSISPQMAAAPVATVSFVATPSRGLARRNRIALPHSPAEGPFARIWAKLMDSVRLERYRRAAARGDPEASYQVGCVLFRGKAVLVSATEALKWFLAAAHRGHVEAQVAAASCFEHGHGAPSDDAEAARWYAAAAQAGSAQGHYGLGSLMLQGRISPATPEQAIAHIREAAQAELPEAYDAMGQLLLNGHGAAKNVDDALECFRRAAALGFAASAHRLGYLHERPHHGQLADPLAAMRWYAKAVKLGHRASNTDLERLRVRFPT